MQQLINTEPGIDITGWLSNNGWSVAEQTAEALADRYQRDLRNPFAERDETELATGQAVEPPWLNTVFLTARR
jgi:hypothetical protein